MKNIIKKIPILGYLLSLGSVVLRLPKKILNIEHALHHQNVHFTELEEKTTSTNQRLIELIQNSTTTEGKLLGVAGTISELKSNKTHTVIESSKKESPTDSGLFADDHSLDEFYLNFEDKFRGDEMTITERLRVYLPYFNNRPSAISKSPFLDIGSGRGEFLDLLTHEKVNIIGLDINLKMVEKAKNKGHSVIEGDALNYLTSQKKNTLAGVSGFHIVEHIPFPELMKIFSECYRVTKKGGMVIFETPNPENLTVGSLTFNYDPSHLKPIPPQLLAFCLEYIGFNEIEILQLHPEQEPQNEDVLVQEALKRIFGPRDYAVIARKS
jgi:O-antigen chain-terminating methyltransferase